MQEYCPTEPGAHHLDLWRPAPDPRVAHLGSNAERPAERRMRSATSWPRYRVVAPSTQVGTATRGYQSVTRKRGHNAFAPLDREFVDDAAYIHLEIEALHCRAREMPGQTARGGCAQSDNDREPHTLIRPNALHVELSAVKNGKSRCGDERSCRERYAS